MLILAEGGLTTPWADIRPAMRLGVSLATVGVAVSVAVMAVVAHYLFGLDWQLAVLLGAVTSPTDAAAVFSVLRRVPLPAAPHRRPRGGVRASTTPRPCCWSSLVSAGAALDHGVLRFVGIVVYELAVGVVARPRGRASAAPG